MPAEQLPLIPAPSPTRAQRRTELAAKRDLRRMRRNGALEDRDALAEAILIAARAADRAEVDHDVWKAAAAIRELRALYSQVGAARDGDDLDEFLAQLNAPVAQ